MIYFKKARTKKIMVNFFFLGIVRTEFERRVELSWVFFFLRATVTSGVGGGVYIVNKKRVKRETKERVLNLLILS